MSNFWEKFKKYYPLICGGIIIIILLLWWRSCNDLLDEKSILDQNIAALQDSTRKITTKDGEEEYARLALVADIEQLKLMNASLAAEVQRERGDVQFIDRVHVRYSTDTIYTNTNEIIDYNDGKYGVKWRWQDSLGSQTLGGETRIKIDSSNGLSVLDTRITENSLKLNLITGLKKNDAGLLEIFARSDNPNIQIDLEGAVLEPEMFYKKDKRWHLVFYGGVGVGTDFVTNIRGEAQIGLGIAYSLFSF